MIGFTLDESALIKYDFHWLDTLLSQNLVSFVELSPEKRAASSSIYLKIKNRLNSHKLSYQLHLPYFVHPTDYRVNSLSVSKQKIVDTLENWLSFTETMRYDDSLIPIIIHPGHEAPDIKSPEDETARFLDLFLNRLHRLGLEKHYSLALENLPNRSYRGFGTSLEALQRFRTGFFHPDQLSLCLDLCHYGANRDGSVIPYSDISLYHIHQYDATKGVDHQSLQVNHLDFTEHYKHLKLEPSARINLELLQVADPDYRHYLSKDLTLLHERLKD